MNDTRRYLLERVDDAAVVQLYADGFAGSLRETRFSSGISIWPRLPAATSITTSATPTTSRCARCSKQSSRTAQDVDPRVLAEIRRYTKLFWINTGPYNNITARKFLLRLTRDELLEALTAARRPVPRLPTAPASRWRGSSIGWRRCSSMRPSIRC